MAAWAKPLPEEALALWQAVNVEAPRHPEILDAVGWLAACLPVQARAGEDRAEREARAERLRTEFGFDFQIEKAEAALGR